MPSLIPLDKSDFLGATLIGLVLSTLVYGITCLQVFLYYTKHSSRDSPFLKAFVCAPVLRIVFLVLDTVHVALLVSLMYHYSVTNFGDYSTLERSTWCASGF
ncbi:hypothetical protein K438DRAFT_1590964 [Mycena galopus ATCC 62051]|nr:hypothetical protein K438DRAFT_1590964 [Mycena galopus ATCC 62051]